MKLNAGISNEKNRDEWLEKTLKQLNPGSKILDAGAGELKYKKFCAHLNYASQDFGQYDGEGNTEGLQTKKWDNSKLDIVSDITKIPVDNNSYDTIMCIEVLEHLPEPINAIKEFSRIIKPNGKLIITAPFCSMTHFAPYFFQTGFSKYWYEKILKDNGFSILEINYNGNYFEYLAQEIRRLPLNCRRYGNYNFFSKILLKIIIYPVLYILTFQSINNKKSEELLCFGLHVVAKKTYDNN